MPHGCREQNMVLFAPNIYVLKYPNETQQLTEEIKFKAISYLSTGKGQKSHFVTINVLCTNRLNSLARRALLLGVPIAEAARAYRCPGLARFGILSFSDVLLLLPGPSETFHSRLSEAAELQTQRRCL